MCCITRNPNDCLKDYLSLTVLPPLLAVVDVTCSYTQAGPRELTPAGELIRATASGASQSPQFQPFSFRLGQIAEGTRLKFAFIDQRGRIAGLATVPGAALLRAVTMRQPATMFVDLRKQRAGAARVKMLVDFSRDPNFERDFKGTLESRAQQAKHRQQHGIAASFVALSEAAVDNAKGASVIGDDGGQQRRQSLLLPSAQVTRYESWITKLPRSSRGFASPKHGQHSGSSKHLGRGAKRRFLSLDNGVLRYYTNESKLDLKGQMSLFSHTEWHEVEGYEYALVVENNPKEGAGSARSPHTARRPLAFICDDQESFRCWKIALSLVKGQMLQEEAAALRGPQPPEAAVEGGDALLSGGEEGRHGSSGGDDGDPTQHAADARLLEMQELARQQEARMREEEAQRQQAYAQYGQQEEALQQRQRELAEQQQRLEDMQRQWELDQQQQHEQQQQSQPDRGMAANPNHVSKMGGQAAVARALQDGGGVQSAASLFAAPQFSFQEPPPPQRPPPPRRPPPRKLTALEEAHMRHAEDHRRKLEQLEHDRQVAAAQGIRLEAGDITTTTIVNIEPDEEDEETKQRKRKRKWIIAGVAVLVGLLLLLLLFVVATAMARLNVVSTGVMIESDIPQLTRPPNAVSAALWLRGQAEYAFTNPGYLTVCVSHVDASMFYVDRAASNTGAPPTLTKITPASNIDLMFPHGGGGVRSVSRPIDTCVPPYATVKLQIPFEVRVMLSPALTQSITDDCSASSQRFAVDVLGSGMAYVVICVFSAFSLERGISAWFLIML